MGHYDDLIAQKEREEDNRRRKEAIAEARKEKLPLLGDSHFVPLGVCAKCATAIYAIPNWNCRENSCPHKPPR